MFITLAISISCIIYCGKTNLISIREDLVNLILKASPKLDNKGVEGKTPKELAVMYNNPKTLQKLQKAEGKSI
jgi:ankyrin repeat protein